MSPPSRRWFSDRAGPHRPSAGGFTLLGVALVVFALSVAAAIAAPVLHRRIVAARAAAVAGDLRAFAAAFQAYAHDRGNWPDAAAPGIVPPGMQTYLAATHWQQRSPIGGRYTWVRHTLQQGERYNAAILISTHGAERVTDDRDQLTQIDRAVDDSDLNGGKFRLGYRNHPVFVIEH